MADWPNRRLAEICVDVGGVQTGPFGTQLHMEDYVTSGTPIITVEHLGDNRITTQNLPLVSNYDRERLSKYSLREGDIVFSRVGSVDRRALVRTREVGWLFSGRCLRVRVDRNLADPAFISFQFGMPSFKEHIRSIAVGATMPSLNTKILGDVTIILPPLAEQQAISCVLGALDDKIELNRRMNETLEAMARAIFKDWFVDFGPTRAKIEGRPAYLAPDIWKLFPDRLDDQEVPDGWKLGRLDDLVILQRGFDLPSDKRRSGRYVVMAASGPNGYHDQFMALGPGVTTGRSGVLGKVFFVHEDFWPLNTSLWVKEFKVATPLHAYFLLQHLEMETFNGGSAVPTLNRNHIHNLQVSVPAREVIEAFDKIGMPLFKLMRANELASHVLVATRNLLLPKLMSGEICVKDVEKIAEPAL